VGAISPQTLGWSGLTGQAGLQPRCADRAVLQLGDRTAVSVQVAPGLGIPIRNRSGSLAIANPGWLAAGLEEES